MTGALLWEHLHTKLQCQVANFAGVAGIYLRDLTTGNEIQINASELFPTASSIKIHILTQLLLCGERGEYLSDRVVSGYRILAFNDDENENNVPVRAGAESERFIASLQDAASLPQIHVQHYLVWPERNEGYPHTYGKGAEMRNAIIGSGNVRLLLSGHYHWGVPLFLDKGVWFATALAFTIAPHPFHIYDLEEDLISSRTFTLAT